MKKLSAVIAASLLSVLVADLQAQVQRVPVIISGIVQTGLKTKVKITDADLVSAVGNRLVVAVDLTNNTVAVEEWNSALSQAVTNRAPSSINPAALLGSYQAGVLRDDGGTKVLFNCDLESNTPDWDGEGFRDSAADLQLNAKGSTTTNGVITKLSGKLYGVINDPLGDHEGHPSTNGYRNVSNTLLWQGNALFKGKLKSTGPAF